MKMKFQGLIDFNQLYMGLFFVFLSQCMFISMVYLKRKSISYSSVITKGFFTPTQGHYHAINTVFCQ